ncbi:MULTISPECIES: hypothetical protein [unclassified Coleofasciculus]|uniref:hypothetical protein n=1 Tax=unclassified Coleofasciculus TaxID=2692782 RepID=UPI00187ED473|nr:MULTISPECIES: hypothetical protein [unclassified Coleofasciculus]MBE9124810.1 hypothetical protein [Coleofasciculus sp. LEGE 07081]MBE9147715.1 hypothetical protein [Coleofasciculus sp. LEGE 07092]
MITDIKRLHLGCGKNTLPGWMNLDKMPIDGVEIIADLDNCKTEKLPFPDNEIDEFYLYRST